MSISTATALADTLPSSVPKLDATGLNWAIFSLCFQDAVEAKGYWGHFDGTTPQPELVVTATADNSAAIAQWDKDERSAKSLLTQKIPDSALMRIRKAKTVKEQWDAITTEYTKKGTFAQTDLRMRFLESKCPEKGNVQQFLDELRIKREELACYGLVCLLFHLTFHLLFIFISFPSLFHVPRFYIHFSFTLSEAVHLAPSSCSTMMIPSLFLPLYIINTRDIVDCKLTYS